jgi:hypothetical protein
MTARNQILINEEINSSLNLGDACHHSTQGFIFSFAL